MSEFIQVTTTATTRQEAGRIAKALLGQRLAACVQIAGPVESHYWWKGQLEQSAEWLCTVKTLRVKYAGVEAAIRAAHSYEVPEIVAIPIETGSAPYLAWLRGEASG